MAKQNFHTHFEFSNSLVFEIVLEIHTDVSNQLFSRGEYFDL